MYTVITGAAGFIGSNLVKALNARGETRILAVDDLTEGDKFRNLVDCEIADYLDKDEFLVRLSDGDFDDEIAAVLHQGACSDTMATDGRSMLANNYRYSVRLLEHCQDNDVPFLYASSAAVYGAGTAFREERACEAPLNVYAYSKFLFDQYVRGIFQPVPGERESPAIRGFGRLRRGRAAPRFRECRGRGQGESPFSRPPRALGDLEYRYRQGSDV